MVDKTFLQDRKFPFNVAAKATHSI